MGKDLLWKVKPGEKISLKNYDASYNAGMQHEEAETQLAQLDDEMSKLQEFLSAAQHHSMLIILQGMDTSGKDGTIRHVFAHINPQGCTVHSFKAPTGEELVHDFLWRVHRATPAKGVIGIFNRSQYEDVLIVRVHQLVPDHVWQSRYEAINHFEHLLAKHNNTIILKFFLHISKDEQEQRLQARVDDREKAWKINAGDWVERKNWEAYQEAYEDALSRCSTDEAPWYIVPANHKWFRNLAIAETVVHTMHQYKDEWQRELEERGRKELESLQQMREGLKVQ